jgi:CRISPR/Cas system CMR subunit Cmr4 (Cas7 group RAMP superfamily)
MNSQLFTQVSSLTYSDFSKTMNESFNTLEGFTYITTNNNTNTANVNFSSHNELRDKLSRDNKYDFNGNTLLFSDENLLISEQIKMDNEMLVTSEDNLKTVTYIAATTMFIAAFILIGMKK